MANQFALSDEIQEKLLADQWLVGWHEVATLGHSHDCESTGRVVSVVATDLVVALTVLHIVDLSWLVPDLFALSTKHKEVFEPCFLGQWAVLLIILASVDHDVDIRVARIGIDFVIEEGPIEHLFVGVSLRYFVRGHFKHWSLGALIHMQGSIDVRLKLGVTQEVTDYTTHLIVLYLGHSSVVTEYIASYLVDVVHSLFAIIDAIHPRS